MITTRRETGDRAGYPTFWRVMGQGPDPALMIHCALAHSGSWTGVAGELADALTMTAFDLPGHGRSAPWDRRGDVHDVTTAVAETFLVPGTHLIGHSFGATVALRLALRHPGQVASLTLVEPVLFAAARGDAAAFATHLARSGPMAASFAAGDHRTAARQFTENWGDGTAWDALSEAQRAAFAAQMPLIEETQPILLDDTAGLLRPGELESLHVPVLFIRGSDTMPIMHAVEAEFARRIGQMQSVLVKGAGHMVPITHPKATAGLIAQRL